jgi:hypothetical protein
MSRQPSRWNQGVRLKIGRVDEPVLQVGRHEMGARGQQIGASAVSGPSGFELRFKRRQLSLSQQFSFVLGGKRLCFLDECGLLFFT